MRILIITEKPLNTACFEHQSFVTTIEQTTSFEEAVAFVSDYSFDGIIASYEMLTRIDTITLKPLLKIIKLRAPSMPLVAYTENPLTQKERQTLMIQGVQPIVPATPEMIWTQMCCLLSFANAEVASNSLEFQDATLHIDRNILSYNGEELHLTSSEAKLLARFFAYPAKIFSRPALMETIGLSPEANERNIDKHVKRIKQKIAVFGWPEFSDLLKPVYSEGYVLENEPTLRPNGRSGSRSFCR